MTHALRCAVPKDKEVVFYTDQPDIVDCRSIRDGEILL